MKTIEQIKNEIIAFNPSRQYEINGLVFDLTDAEYNEAINNKAEMILAQEQDAVEKEAIRQAKISAYEKLGLTQAEIEALIPSLTA